jgi:hypothetical protein
MTATPSDFATGQEVSWQYVAPGGYCIAWWVLAVVVRVGPKKVTIDAALERGGAKRVAVMPENLRPRRPAQPRSAWRPGDAVLTDDGPLYPA